MSIGTVLPRSSQEIGNHTRPFNEETAQMGIGGLKRPKGTQRQPQESAPTPRFQEQRQEVGGIRT